LMKLGRRGLS